MKLLYPLINASHKKLPHLRKCEISNRIKLINYFGEIYFRDSCMSGNFNLTSSDFPEIPETEQFHTEN